MTNRKNVVFAGGRSSYGSRARNFSRNEIASHRARLLSERFSSIVASTPIGHTVPRLAKTGKPRPAHNPLAALTIHLFCFQKGTLKRLGE